MHVSIWYFVGHKNRTIAIDSPKCNYPLATCCVHLYPPYKNILDLPLIWYLQQMTFCLICITDTCDKLLFRFTYSPWESKSPTLPHPCILMTINIIKKVFFFYNALCDPLSEFLDSETVSWGPGQTCRSRPLTGAQTRAHALFLGCGGQWKFTEEHRADEQLKNFEHRLILS